VDDLQEDEGQTSAAAYDDVAGFDGAVCGFWRRLGEGTVWRQFC
jgi:hypothetical protein